MCKKLEQMIDTLIVRALEIEATDHLGAAWNRGREVVEKLRKLKEAFDTRKASKPTTKPEQVDVLEKERERIKVAVTELFGKAFPDCECTPTDEEGGRDWCLGCELLGRVTDIIKENQ